MAGKVYLIGAGPGDPDLLTVRALKLLQSAELVVHDRLVSPEIMALIPATARRVPVGKAAGFHSVPQDRINEILVELAREGHSVIRLKGGDPLIFGRGSEEAEALAAAGIPYSYIPGITAAQGASASTGVPLTHRGSRPACAMSPATARRMRRWIWRGKALPIPTPRWWSIWARATWPKSPRG